MRLIWSEILVRIGLPCEGPALGLLMELPGDE